MAFELITQINESANDEQNYINLVESTIKELFGDDAAGSVTECQVAWDAAEDADRKDTVKESSAAMGRAAERDWLQQVSDETAEKKELKNRKLGIKSQGEPEAGQFVIMQGGVGKIVAIDKPSKQVIIQNKAGKEKVFKYTDLAGPKEVKGKKAWALKAAM